jgi:hypothetical protein
MTKSSYYLYREERKNGRPVFYVRIVTENGYKTFSTKQTIRAKAEASARMIYDEYKYGLNNITVDKSKIIHYQQKIAEQQELIEKLQNPIN